MQKNKTTAIILAAGSGKRMNLPVTKQRLTVAGESILKRTLRAFDACEDVDFIVLVTRADEMDFAKEESSEISKLCDIVVGGEVRAESAAIGFSRIPEQTAFVAIHDGARPLVLPEDISRCAHDAFCCGGAVLAVPVTDTIKYGKKNGFVEYTPAREKLFAAQTPQIFDLAVYKTAMERAFRELSDWTDDSRIFENDARKVFLTPGKRYNIKITSPEDILIAEALLKGREEK